MKKIITSLFVAAVALVFVSAPSNSAQAGSCSYGNGYGNGYYTSGYNSYRPKYAWRKVKIYDSCGHYAGYRWKRVRVY